MVVWGGRGDGVRDGEIGRGGAVRVGGLGVGVCGGRATSKTDRTGHRNGPNWLRKAGAAELAVWGCAIRAIIALPKGRALAVVGRCPRPAWTVMRGMVSKRGDLNFFFGRVAET